MDRDLKNYTLDQLEDLVTNLNRKKYLARYIFTFIQTKNARDLWDITPLPKTFRTELAKQHFFISSLKTVETHTDPDGTVKYLFELPDGKRIESVMLFDDKRKTILCISTQTGCSMNCVSATAKIKFQRNLTAAEITDQLSIIENDRGKIHNIVYMGMGEPLLNYDSVLKSLCIINHPLGKNIGIRHLTISTCGLPHAIRTLAAEPIRPRLAVSLNAPNDKLRSRIMPVNKKHPIKELFSALKYYTLKTAQRVTIEYVLIKGLNDSFSCAEQLVGLVKNLKCNINLIEYNPHTHCKFAPSTKEAINCFAEILTDAGLETTIRLRKGPNIKAACGQLGRPRCLTRKSK